MKSKIIGLIGGISPEATLKYYEYCFHGVNKIVGNNHTGVIVIYSIDMEVALDAYKQNDWKSLNRLMKYTQKQLKRAGADFFAICCNTLHKVWVENPRIFSRPVVSIFDPIVKQIQTNQYKKVGLLGSRATLLDGFYQGALKAHEGLEILIPEAKDIEILDNIIFGKLVKGQFNDVTMLAALTGICDKLVGQGAEAIILGCTELPIAFQSISLSVPLIDSMHLHCDAIVNYSLGITCDPKNYKRVVKKS